MTDTTCISALMACTDLDQGQNMVVRLLQIHGYIHLIRLPRLMLSSFLTCALKLAGGSTIG